MFRELCKRQHHRRFDVRVPVPGEGAFDFDDLTSAEESSAWKALHAEAHRRAWAVLEKFVRGEPNIDLAGCVISLPGSGGQKFHQDGSLAGFFNVFVPLVDITPENGPTEFQPGTQVPPTANALAFDAAPAEPVAPCPRQGEVLIFDYRIRHRGLANLSGHERPVAYLVYTPRGLSDIHNFPADRSLLREPAERPGDRQEPPDWSAVAASDEADGHTTPPAAPALAGAGRAAEPAGLRRLRFSNVSQERLGFDGFGVEDTEYREVRGAGYAAATPCPLLEPTIVAISAPALSLLGVRPDEVTAEELCGNCLPLAASPAAHCYCGYQFGTFSGQLGDGAALSLGEVVTDAGGILELNLEGSGINPLTRYWYAGLESGRKPTDAMVREFLIAESLFALGVPTTRALGVVSGKDSAKASAPPCGTLLRAAGSFLRFGSFEVTLPHGTGHHAPSAFDWELLRRMADHCMASHYPDLLQVPDEPDEEDDDLRVAPRYHALLLEITRRTARLGASWHCLGAVHGMLNTDNLSVLGLSLDHGSFSFMDHYDPRFAGHGKELGGRYCFREQPAMLRWGCERLAEALLPLHCTALAEMIGEVDSAFDAEFATNVDDGMQRKLGLRHSTPKLVEELLALMESASADWTCTFRALTDATSPEDALVEIVKWSRGGTEEAWRSWLEAYTEQLTADASSWHDASRVELMRRVNPAVVPRGRLLDRVARAAELGDFDELRRMFGMLTAPYGPPADPSDAQPSAASSLDPSRMAHLRAEAAEALQDAEVWRRHCPQLHVASDDWAKRPRGMAIDGSRAEVLRSAMRRHGVFSFNGADLPWSVDLAALARGVEQLHAAGRPPCFIAVYDEFWALLAELAPVLKDVLRHDVCFDFMVHRMEPGRPGLAPRRERPLAGWKSHNRPKEEVGFNADGMPAFATAWVPLGDVPETGPCLMGVPRGHDQGYLEAGRLHWGAEMLHHIRPVSPVARGASVLSHRFLHWWTRGDELDDSGRTAAPSSFLSLAVAADAFESPRLPRRLLPFPPLSIRVALASGQTLVRGDLESAEMRVCGLMWECFLACSEHFEASFCTEVFKKSPLGGAA